MRNKPLVRMLRVLFVCWLPFVAWMALIFWLSDQPKLPHPMRRMGISDYLFDYSAHLFTFGVLTVLTWRTLAISPTFWPSRWPRLTPFVASAWATLYAASDEWHQRYVPGRWSNLKDWAADMAGVLLALGLLLLWRRWSPSLWARLATWRQSLRSHSRA